MKPRPSAEIRRGDAAADHRARHHRDARAFRQVEQAPHDQRAAHHRREHHQHVLDTEERCLDRARVVVQLEVELGEAALGAVRQCVASAAGAPSSGTAAAWLLMDFPLG